ncbi:ribonuclease D [Idiomarina seosinensis]|uniref:Ribonuclease D n=1 Tax=Idiomarina seosinensis TaxID=281739 RepID=A0A432ZJN3_9GAMM|nr:ribonuclease D [Idiomarina seosinensis]RUO78030.1 ribonuclease D [Idiomarina seosinensis]
MSLIQVADSVLSYRVIDTTDDLQQFCQSARTAGWLAIDTEFVRQRTYYAKLGLLQAHANGQTVIIDPLKDVELEPLWSLICDAEVVKVVHAGGEDIELFYHQAGQHQPQAIFDSQIAAGFCGLGSSIGYAKLVEQLCGGVELDKSLSRTDWLKRPLTPEQLDYAAADASYLSAMYPYLLEKCQQRQVLDIVLAESRLQVDKRTQSIADDLLYLFVGNAWQCNQQQLGVLRELAAWRQHKAQQRDMPLGFIFKDGVLLELARRQPTTEKQLFAVSDLPPLTRKYSGTEIVSVIQRAVRQEPEQLPATLQRLDDMEGYKATVKTIKAAVQRVAEELDVDTVLVASRKQINDFLNFHWQFSEQQQQRLPKPDLNQGWRWQFLKAELQTLM